MQQNYQQPLDFRRSSGSTLSYSIPAHFFERVAQSAEINEDANVDLTVGLQSNEPDAYALSLHVRAGLMVRCERCMKMFSTPVDARSQFVVAKNTKEADRIAAYVDENIEVLVASEIESTLQLCEDEILLAIPYSPRCSDGCKLED